MTSCVFTYCTFIMGKVSTSQQIVSHRGICEGYNLTSLTFRPLCSLFGRVGLQQWERDAGYNPNFSRCRKTSRSYDKWHVSQSGSLLIGRPLAAIYACHSSPIWRGRCQEVTELCTSPPHDWWPQGGLLTKPPVYPLAKKKKRAIRMEEVAFDVKWWRGIYCAAL